MTFIDAWSQTAAHGLLQIPNGQLEIMTTPVQDEAKVAVICHPHPLHDGTMRNKVVSTLAKACQKRGYATLCFNYRGVGESSGEYGDMVGEIEDLKAVLDFVKRALPSAEIGLAGFSFGSYIAASVANETDDYRWLMSVAPSVEHADFSKLTNVKCPWAVFQGEEDEIVPFDAVNNWYASMPNCETIVRFIETSHFFHGKLVQLREEVDAWLDECS